MHMLVQLLLCCLTVLCWPAAPGQWHLTYGPMQKALHLLGIRFLLFTVCGIQIDCFLYELCSKIDISR